MLGEVERQERLREPHAAAGKPLLSVRGLSRRGVLHDIGFELHPGEIVGLWGLLGSGRTELVRALIGLDPIDSGELRFAADSGDRPITPAALHREVGLVTEDRRGEGLLMPLSVVGNLSLASLGQLLNPFAPDRPPARAGVSPRTSWRGCRSSSTTRASR